MIKPISFLYYSDGATFKKKLQRRIIMKTNNYDFQNLNIGNNGIMVYILQKNLNEIGENLVEDGIFGKNTNKTVKEFQTLHNLDANGIVDYKTMIEIDLEYERQHSKAV
jgi:peptidoglycan hydrolase-like protein with peptidoglycan-binding domain